MDHVCKNVGAVLCEELVERQLDIVAVLLQHCQICLPVREAHRFQVGQGGKCVWSSPLLRWGVRFAQPNEVRFAQPH